MRTTIRISINEQWMGKGLQNDKHRKRTTTSMGKEFGAYDEVSLSSFVIEWGVLVVLPV